MPVTFYNIPHGDPCLTQDPCSICFDDVTAANGKAHSPPLSWGQRKPVLQHAIHETCLRTWIRTQLNKAQTATCPTCRSAIALPLKDRAIAQFKFMARDAFVGAIIGSSLKAIITLVAAVKGTVAPRVGVITAELIGNVILIVSGVLLANITVPLEAATGAGVVSIGAVVATIGARVATGEKFGVTAGLASVVGAAAIGIIKRRYFA
jgi:hypothetical protein